MAVSWMDAADSGIIDAAWVTGVPSKDNKRMTVTGRRGLARKIPKQRNIGLKTIFCISILPSEAYRRAELEEKGHGDDAQYPPVSRKPLELIHAGRMD